jgi:hypothetical protein
VDNVSSLSAVYFSGSPYDKNGFAVSGVTESAVTFYILIMPEVMTGGKQNYIRILIKFQYGYTDDLHLENNVCQVTFTSSTFID